MSADVRQVQLRNSTSFLKHVYIYFSMDDDMKLQHHSGLKKIIQLQAFAKHAKICCERKQDAWFRNIQLSIRQKQRINASTWTTKTNKWEKFRNDTKYEKPSVCI